MQSPVSTPAFGQADLSNCEREQIHLAGSIQPHGVLLLLREPDLRIVQASANAQSNLRLPHPLLGLPIGQLSGDLPNALRALPAHGLRGPPVALRCRFGDPAHDYDALVHRPAGDVGIALELEPARRGSDAETVLAEPLARIVGCPSLHALCDEAARIFKSVAGYDRVMVYRFDEHGHGEVFSESREPRLEAFLGNRYPASDIPQMARRLYMRTRVRMLVDVNYDPSPILPRLSPISGAELDLSLCSLRSMSPIHIQYLKNMGVGATLVISLVVGGRLWGLISCHHYSPRFVSFEVRSQCELLAEAMSTRITALESFLQSQAELAVRRLEQRMIEAISSEGDWRRALFNGSSTVLQPVAASGAALLFDGQVLTTGDVPGTLDLRDLGAWLDRKGPSRVFSTASLGIDDPDFAPLTKVASGLLAAPISNAPGEYILWFRPERIRTITWGGNPFKPVVVGDDPRDLSPRRSFSQWHQLMEGNSEPWTPADLAAARLIATTIADVVLQFRSVQMLILKDQIDRVRQDVRLSEQAVVIADASGRIVLINDMFEQLLPATHHHLEWMEDLPSLFDDPPLVRRRIEGLIERHETWRGEVFIENRLGGLRPLLVRADPVFASPMRARGFILLLTDNSENKAAATARRRFQERLMERHHMDLTTASSGADLVYHNLMASIVENAQLAALEITDRADVERMPELLDSIRASVTRTTEVLDFLIKGARSSSTS